ncbi:hypothetical protein V8F33_011002 [Rhypophila sp. PSN 637]
MWFNLDDFSAHASGRKKGKARKCIQSQLLENEEGGLFALSRFISCPCHLLYPSCVGGRSTFFFCSSFFCSFCLYCLGDVGYLLTFFCSWLVYLVYLLGLVSSPAMSTLAAASFLGYHFLFLVSYIILSSLKGF